MRAVFLAVLTFALATPAYSAGFTAIQITFHPQQAAQGKVYMCPMHHHIIRDEPGTCPICGMALVVKQSPVNKPAAKRSFSLSEEQQQAINIATATVIRMDLKPFLSLSAQVNWNMSEVVSVHPRASGWIEKLYTKNPGDWVNKGDKLYRIYAPDVVVAQDDYLQLLQNLQSIQGAEEQRMMKMRGKQRLRLLGMTDEQISKLQQRGTSEYQIDYFAPQAGYLTDLNVREGMYVKPSTRVLTLSGYERPWVLLDIPTQHASQVKVGQSVTLYSGSYGERLVGKTSISYLYPQLDQRTQTLVARAVLKRLPETLKVGDWLTARVALPEQKNVLVIPVSSVIREANIDRVVVQDANGKFTVRAVILGDRYGDRFIVDSGLTQGERVVTNGQFLIDSEATLRGFTLPAAMESN
ncbi:efflux RND transporter periplasmic adaptor subunit [Idiomarina tyrosinivorans]|uniref:Efflux RND transporter periplasmic adaptor subunit n=1 Tax=Idiomarina tyrosinivorans TaxID=1445662 RepID=A0A432ZQD2_9GAMM|nr:efflux RND transporter periplasmic adaptor subunit [Idiomarina tyrosinivorans]RUO80052.1 efflux RND transporter periplasmic adaptor subunit [Idiomarina tyrosinivorans]